MSQYPSPYSPPGVMSPYAGPNVLKPARRAGVVMLVLGTLMILISGCFIGMPFSFPYLPAEQIQPIRDRIASVTSLPPEVLLWRMGGTILVLGITFVVLALFVRRGGFVSTVLSIILTGLILIQQTLSLVVSFLTVGSPSGLGNFCGNAFTFCVFLLLLVWLIQAVRAIPNVKASQQQYLMQYWQHDQKMQTFGGYPTQTSITNRDQPQSDTPDSNQPLP